MGDRSTEFGKIVLKFFLKKEEENIYASWCMLKQLFTSVSVNSVDIYLAASRFGKYLPLFMHLHFGSGVYNFWRGKLDLENFPQELA